MKGTPGNLRDTGEGYVKNFFDANGSTSFVIFWTPSTGAHAVSGAIMQTYKSEGWHFSDLGYPKSDEKDLAGVTNGRYNEFQKGVIAHIKGKDAQVYPTVQDAVAKLKVTPVTGSQILQGQINQGFIITEPEYRVKVQFNSITIYRDQEPEGLFETHNDGEWSMRAVVNGKYVDLDKGSGGKLWDARPGQTIYFTPYTSIITVIPSGMPLSVYTLGFESDGCGGSFGTTTENSAVVPILKGPKSEWKSEIRRIIDRDIDALTTGKHDCNDRLGFINDFHLYPHYGAGKRSILSSGPHPDDPNSGWSFGINYTVSVEKITK